MAEFFHMGGHAYFIWTSYAIVCVTFLYAFFSPILRHRKLLRELPKVTPVGKEKRVVATLETLGDTSADNS